jgi:hypothetical protein
MRLFGSPSHFDPVGQFRRVCGHFGFIGRERHKYTLGGVYLLSTSFFAGWLVASAQWSIVDRCIRRLTLKAWSPFHKPQLRLTRDPKRDALTGGRLNTSIPDKGTLPETSAVLLSAWPPEKHTRRCMREAGPRMEANMHPPRTQRIPTVGRRAHAAVRSSERAALHPVN